MALVDQLRNMIIGWLIIEKTATTGITARMTFSGEESATVSAQALPERWRDR